MTEILAIVNQKGGVGKTTTAINLGAAIAALERPVLIVDCDPQGNATRGLGAEAEDPHLYQVLLGDAEATGAIRETGFPYLSVMPSDRDLVGLEVEMVGQPGWEGALQRALGQLGSAYHTILLDCPPSLGHLTINALVAADAVLVPLQCEYYALEGVTALLDTIRRVQGSFNPGLRLEGILLTMYDGRTNLSKDVAQEVRKHFQEQVYEVVVPRNVRLAEAPSHGMPILQYDIKCRGAEAYLALARELLRRAA